MTGKCRTNQRLHPFNSQSLVLLGLTSVEKVQDEEIFAKTKLMKVRFSTQSL